MNIEDIENYIIRYNLNYPSRKGENVYKRMFLYAYLYHHHKWTLERIAKLFNKKDHVVIRHALLDADVIQHHKKFIEATSYLKDCTSFIIPKYDPKSRTTKKKPKRKEETITITVTLTKRKFLEYTRKKDPKVILNMLWKIMSSKPRKF